MTSSYRILPLVGCLLILSFGLTSCSAPSTGSSERKGLFGGNKKWRESFDEGQGAVAGNGWNNNLPAGSIQGADSSYSRVKISQPYIAMTFDDGPHPSNTPRLLDMLKQRNIKATFYVVGSNAKAYPHILKRMVAEGHEVANHTWNHPDMTKLSQASVRKELNSCRDAIVAATGIQPITYRPPYGAINSSLKSWVQQEYGYPAILWSVDPMDWKKPGASVVADRLVSGAHNGAILLAHDIHAPTIDAMPSALDRLLQKGYRFVTVSQLINLEQRAAMNDAPGHAPNLAPNPAPTPAAPMPAQNNPGVATPVPNPIPVSRDSAEAAPSEETDSAAEMTTEEPAAAEDTSADTASADETSE